MDVGSLVFGFAAGALLVGALVWWTLRQTYAVRQVALSTERDLLVARVDDLESALRADSETVGVLAPLQRTLGQVQQQVATLERDRVEQYGELGSLLRQVAGTTAALGDQTASLAGSLRSSNTSGLWGEAQLRRVLEHSGMLPNCDFDEQVRGFVGEVAVRPDAVVRLPGERIVVIDSKAPIATFLEAQAAGLPDDERDGLLRRHSAVLTRHVDGLAAKTYWQAFDQTPELVLCFVPADAILSSALRADPALFDRAAARHVVLVSPSTLLAALRAISLVWQQDSVTRNAQELLVLGQTLYERLGTLGKHTADLGSALRKSVERYNLLVGSLESRVMVTARAMHELGVSPTAPAALEPVDAAPRPLTAAELLEALDTEVLDAEVARPQLLFDETDGPQARSQPRDDRDVG